MKRMPPIILQLEEQLQPYISGTYARFSKRKVPHLVIWARDEVYSACFFGGSKTWRLFFPYPSNGDKQTKIDFPDIKGVVDYFKKEASKCLIDV